jgi:hypothetical protein
MLFSEAYCISKGHEKEWLDPSFDSDIPLFIDPILLSKTKNPYFKESKEKINLFFQKTFEKIAKARKKGLKALKTTEEILKFKEPKETLIGYTQDGSAGRGLGLNFSLKLRDSIVDLIDMGIDDLPENIAIFNLLVEGIGPDGISDMITNIIKDDLVKYTQGICQKEKIPTKEFLVNNLGYDYDNDLWNMDRVPLPENKRDKKNPVILIPKDILRSEEIINIINFEYYFNSIDNDTLRKRATKIFTSNLDTKKIKKAIKENPKEAKAILGEYIKFAESLDYSILNIGEKEFFYKFHRFFKEIVSTLPIKKTEEKTEASLINFVEEVIQQYKHVVEKRQGWEFFFDENNKPKTERTMQILFWDIADTMCKLNKDIVISPEGQTGRGPVDFKFSLGFDKKIVVEIKRILNADFYKGYFNQLPTYIKSDEAIKGYYVSIKLRDQDTARYQNLLRKIEEGEKIEEIKKEIKDKMEPVEIDARIKLTASKVK